MIAPFLVFGPMSCSLDPEGIRHEFGVSTPLHDAPAAFGPQSGSLYITRADSAFVIANIYEVPQNAEARLAPFSTGPYDAGLTFRADGKGVVFTSKRATESPSSADEWNLWISDGSREARPLPEPVNSPASECCVAFIPGGSFLFSSNRAGSWDIFMAEPAADGGYVVTRLSGSINSELGEWVSFVDETGRLALFSSIRPDGFGGDDIYVACADPSDPTRWVATILPAPVNTGAYEDSAILTPDGRRLFWSSRRVRADGASDADIYSMPVRGVVPACGEGGT